MLIDDNSDDNFYYQRVIKKQNLADTVIAMTDAIDALDYLKRQDPAAPLPDMIFLDINMPGMNGWEFLQEYQKLQFRTRIIILTTSENPDDKAKAMATGIVSDFRTKPISKEMIQAILERLF